MKLDPICHQFSGDQGFVLGAGANTVRNFVSVNKNKLEGNYWFERKL
jgi:hypothetical protein